MNKIIKLFLSSLFIINITGCGLATMKEVPLVESVEDDHVLVNIVRPRVFAGDGAKTEMWDGDKFIGTLSAGSMIQYQTIPGDHIFMVYTQGSWGVAKGELKPGKTYFLKFNIGFGFVSLGVAKSDDPRINQWSHNLTPVAIDLQASKPVPEKEVNKARAIYQLIERGGGKATAITDEHAI